MKTESPKKLWSREYVILLCVNFLTSLNFYSAMSIIPRYSLDVLGMSSSQAGFASGIFVIGLLSSRFFAGRFVNIIGFKKMQIIGITSFVIATIGYFFVSTPITLYFVRFLTGAAFGTTSNTNITIVTSIIPVERSGAGVGYYSMFQMLAMAVGPFLALNFVNNGSYTSVFMFCTILPAISLTLLPFQRLTLLEQSLKRIDTKKSLFDSFFERKVFPIAVITFSSFVVYATLLPFIDIYSQAIGLPEVATVFFFVNAVAILLTRPFVSRLFDRKGPNIIILPAIVIDVIGFFILSQARHGIILLLAAALLGIGSGAIQTATLALVVHITPKQRLGTANATYYMALDLSAATGPILGGTIIIYTGFRGFFEIASFWTLVCLPTYYFLYARKQKWKKSE